MEFCIGSYLLAAIVPAPPAHPYRLESAFTRSRRPIRVQVAGL
jgi:hypothetical protein